MHSFSHVVDSNTVIDDINTNLCYSRASFTLKFDE